MKITQKGIHSGSHEYLNQQHKTFEADKELTCSIVKPQLEAQIKWLSSTRCIQQGTILPICKPADSVLNETMSEGAVTRVATAEG